MKKKIFYILLIFSNFNIDLAGIKTGDIIQSINNLDLTKFNSFEQIVNHINSTRTALILLKRKSILEKIWFLDDSDDNESLDYMETESKEEQEFESLKNPNYSIHYYKLERRNYLTKFGFSLNNIGFDQENNFIIIK